jgi:RNA polymerase sigma factor (sigma-70 family)
MNHPFQESLFESHLELALKIGRSFPIPNAALDESEQEARIALWQAASSFDPAKGDFAGYASVVVRNHLRNVFNSAKRRSVEITALDATASDDPDAEIDSPKNSLICPEASPLLDAERSDIRAVLRTELDSLTESQQRVLMSYAEGDSFADIARRNGISKAAVRQMAERAANQIRPELHDLGVNTHYLPYVGSGPHLNDLAGRGRKSDTQPEGIGYWILALFGLLLMLGILAVIFSQ